MALEPQPQSVRVLTDLAQGQVAMDDQPAADLQDGQFVFDRVPPGTHVVKVTSKTGEATFTVDIADAKLPEVQGPIAAKNLIAVLVASCRIEWRPCGERKWRSWKLSLNGQPQG